MHRGSLVSEWRNMEQGDTLMKQLQERTIGGALIKSITPISSPPTSFRLKLLVIIFGYWSQRRHAASLVVLSLSPTSKKIHDSLLVSVLKLPVPKRMD